MRIAIIVLSIAAALGILLAAWRARAARLHRLADIVGSGSKRPVADEEGARILDRLLPRGLMRNLRLLDIEPAPRDLAAIFGTFALVLFAADLLGGARFAVLLGAAIPLLSAMALNILASRRIDELGALMPGFFDRVRQLLIIGNSLPTAFSRAVQGSQPRLAKFFAPAIRRIGNGAGFSESIRQSADDIGLYEMRLFSAAVSTNLRFGGSLTHSLNNLVLFLRKRASIERELRANTSQIRFSAWVLALLPAFVASLIVTQNQDYARWFVTDPLGNWLLGYCVLSQIAGVVVMRAIIRTEM